MLSQLVYVSVRSADCTDAEIEKILQSSIRNNGKIDITGVLLYSSKKFIQVLEGEYDEIIKLYDKIKEDTRHRNVIMVSLGPIQQRTFPSWQMGSKKFELEGVEFRTQMDDTDKSEFQSILAGNSQDVARAVSLIKKFFN